MQFLLFLSPSRFLSTRGGAALPSFLSWVRESLPLRERFPPIRGCRRELGQRLRADVARAHCSALIFTASLAFLHTLERAGDQRNDHEISLVLLFFLPLHWLHNQPPPRSLPGSDNSRMQTYPWPGFTPSVSWRNHRYEKMHTLPAATAHIAWHDIHISEINLSSGHH